MKFDCDWISKTATQCWSCLQIRRFPSDENSGVPDVAYSVFSGLEPGHILGPPVPLHLNLHISRVLPASQTYVPSPGVSGVTICSGISMRPSGIGAKIKI